MSTTLRKPNYERYHELVLRYDISFGVSSLIPQSEKTRMTPEQLTEERQKILDKYDIVIERIGSGYAHTKYRVLKNEPGLSTEDLAILCDKGNLCFGYRTEGSIICVYTD